jgi:hypothetical protein
MIGYMEEIGKVKKLKRRNESPLKNVCRKAAKW